MLKQSKKFSETMRESGFYHSVGEIGSHEDYFRKIGNFSDVESPYRVTFVSFECMAKAYTNDSIIDVSEGLIIGSNVLIKTNGADVELESSGGSRFRLSGRSEFCVEKTVEGIKPVAYGNVFYKNENLNIYASWKYRTSCWVGHTSPVIVSRIDNSSDLYYTLDMPLKIYEYDERGQKFEIVSLKPYQKCVLMFDFKKNLRNRYTVKSIGNLNKKEIGEIYDQYVAEYRWSANNTLQCESQAV